MDSPISAAVANLYIQFFEDLALPYRNTNFEREISMTPAALRRRTLQRCS